MMGTTPSGWCTATGQGHPVCASVVDFMSDAELYALTALEQADLMARRELSSSELTDAYLRRIHKLNPSVWAFPDVYTRRARMAAKRADQDRRKGQVHSCLHGVPSAIKDVQLVRFSRSRFGSHSPIVPWSPVDDRHTRTVRNAGMVITGKTATSELGILATVEDTIHPATRNPWDLSRNACGSSGGAAAAVASYMLPVAPGSDGAGSIRIPAAACGLFGFKPSRGVVPNPFGMPDAQSLIAEGCLARTVSDGTALLDILSHREGKTYGFAAAQNRPLPRLRVRFSLETPLYETDSAVQAPVLEVVALLQKQGHEVREAPLHSTGIDDFLPLMQFLLGHLPGMRWDKTHPMTQWMHERGKHVTKATYDAKFDELVARVAAWFGDADIWITPTMPILAPKLGFPEDTSDNYEYFRRAAVLGAYTATANVWGQPAASLPLAQTDAGLPVGVHFMARPGDDMTLLALCMHMEREMPWHHRKPNLMQPGQALEL